ncbi:MAG: serine hydrolase [Planctomycetia bacterium]|nr:serine hydrolase [Planctomycetia bacterium]
METLRPWLVATVVFSAPFAHAPATLAAADSAPAAVTPVQIKAAVAQIEKLAEQTLKSTGVPGIAIAIVYKDDDVLLRGFGVREAGKTDRIDADTVFQLASVSKPITTTVLAALVGEGLIDWDDRVIDRDPNFRLFDPWATRELRLRDLLCHRSSLPDHGGDLLEDMGYSRDEILYRLRYQTPASSFRSQYAYTNFGFTEAAIAATKAVRRRGAGSPAAWEDLAAEKLYRPLGMKSTSSRYDDFAKTANRAHLHVPVEGHWVAKNVRQPDAQSPAGGVSSTLRDLTHWMRLQLDGGKCGGRQLVDAAALAETHRRQITIGFDPATNRASFYGLGWNIGTDHGGRAFWRHSGGFALGMRSEVTLLPSEGVGIVVLSNAAPTGVPEGITESFFDFLLEDKLSRDWVKFANQMFAEEVKRELGAETDYSRQPEQTTPALPLAAYAGTYRNAYFGDIEIADEKGKPVLRLGPRKMPFALRHWDRDTFIYQPTGESAGGPSGVRFSIGPDQTAASVLIENLNVHEMGTFERRVAE